MKEQKVCLRGPANQSEASGCLHLPN